MIVGLAGRIHSGKDSIGRVLIEQLGFKRVAFADGVRDKVAETYGWDRKWVYSDDFKKARVLEIGADTATNRPANRPIGAMRYVFTGREVLQREGVASRKVFGGDCWIKVALAKCAEGPCVRCGVIGHEAHKHFIFDGIQRRTCACCGGAQIHGYTETADGTHEYYKDSSRYVITDVRFPNEHAAIKAAGEKVIRLNRAESLATRHDFKPCPMLANGMPECGLGNVCHYDVDPSKINFCKLPPSAHPASYSADQHASEVSLPDASQHAFEPQEGGGDSRLMLGDWSGCAHYSNGVTCGLPREAHPTDPVIYDGTATGSLEENTVTVLGLVKGWLR